MAITLITGNPGKMKEYEAIANGRVDITMQALDLAEIQSLDLQEIVTDKLRRAYSEIKSPVIVEDISAGLESLKGLPGPFIKFFEQKLGKGALYLLAHEQNEKVTITCLAGYYDGKDMLFGEGVIHGTVVEPRGERGFGFDFTIVPDGETRTWSEMTLEEKNAFSHRAIAFRSLIDQITS